MTKKFDLSFDVLTIIAALMVVYFHCNPVIYSASEQLFFLLSVVIRCITFSAIPIFFMLSGAKLLSYRERYSTKEYAKKRLLRVCIPFLFWNIFYVIYDVLTYSEMPFNSVRSFISMFFNSSFQTRYWFFWPLFAVYLVIPVLSLLLSVRNHRKYLWYLVGITFFLRWILQPVLSLLGIAYNNYFVIPMCGGYLMYVLFGYLVSTQQIKKSARITLYVGAILSGLFTVFYTITSSNSAGSLQEYMLSYDCFPSALTGAAIFVFVRQIFTNSQKLSNLREDSKPVRLIRKVSSACMGVWLTHSLGMVLVEHFVGNGFVFRYFCPPIIFLLCAVTVLIIKRIPLLKHIV